MTARRPQLRANEMGKTGPINDALLDICRRLEALERTRFIEVQVQTDATSSVSNIVFAKPPWPVKAVYVAKLFNVTTSNDDYLSQSLMWHVAEGGITIPIIYFSGASTKYAITFEVRG